MKQRTIFLLLIVIFIASLQAMIMSQEAQTESDNSGKVVLQILDANTGKPVNEVFRINIFNSLEWNPQGSAFVGFVNTDDNGSKSIYMNPGFYYIQALPESPQSNFELQPSPLLVENPEIKPIVVEKGKITKVLKKVSYGGRLKIALVDPNGRKVIPRELVKDSGINAFISSDEGLVGTILPDSFSASTLNRNGDKIDDGEVVFNRLAPGKYNISVAFGYLGIKTRTIKGIQIIRNQTVTKNLIVDFSGNTGVEGNVKDQNGNPLSNLTVEIDGAETRTDKNGHYKLVTLIEGEHEISIYSSMVDKSNIFINECYPITIVKDKIIVKNYVIDLN